MALPAAYTKAAEIITDLSLRQEEFDWANRTDGDTLASRVAKAIRKARLMVVQTVGTGNYASTDDTTLEAVKVAEFELACSDMMRQRAVILSSRPEEAPPPEYIDVDTLLALATSRRADALALLLPYQTEETAENMPGLGFSMGAVGIDETEADYGDGDYDETDFDSLPS